jgi:ATP-dependent protease HslVU (ClpYQ) ATPase subunit
MLECMFEEHIEELDAEFVGCMFEQYIEELEQERLLNPDMVAREAIIAVESDGIVFIDEIDKIVSSAETRHGNLPTLGFSQRYVTETPNPRFVSTLGFRNP